MTRLYKRILYFVLMAFAAYGCSTRPEFAVVKDIPNEAWYADSMLVFDVPVSDTTNTYRVEVEIRHAGTYAYRNLYVGRDVLNRSGTLYHDTAEFQLATPEGGWIGDGIAGLKTIALAYRAEGLKFSKPDTFRFRLQHLMRDEPLQGIHSVALKLYREGL
ncbi:MAG: gliding motility lipoprotein GldH [Schleiferiaceae bacterium]